MAVKAYEEKMRVDPQNSIKWYRKSKALKKLGRLQEAEVALSKAKELGYIISEDIVISTPTQLSSQIKTMKPMKKHWWQFWR